MDKGESKFITKRIKVFGIVQGVGFRPLVYHIAKKLNIVGTVQNVGGYVEIILKASEETIQSFLNELKFKEDQDYEIVKLEIEGCGDTHAKDFTIIDSTDSNEVSLLVPDLPVCSKCLAELSDSKNRRYQNPFISCTSCGPRYTIIEELPYDRTHTTMKDFVMCDACRKEYIEAEDRRYHAQTVSCNDCGPYLIYQDNDPRTTHLRKQMQPKHNSEPTEYIYEEAFEKAVAAIQSGGILAVKGIGGYHLVCSPFMEETVQKLRRLKGREEKPFAVMFEAIASIKEICIVSQEEEELLKSKARPIVLLDMRTDTMAPSTNKGSIYCGAFLPYTPLQQRLLEVCGPLIMTSANLSGQPIIREDEAILRFSSPYFNGVLYHERRILRSVDDSVAKLVDGKMQLIRRSRGYVPYPIFLTDKHKDAMIFAAGGDLKAAFCFYRENNAVVSQYLGDLEEVTVLEEYEKAYEDLTNLLRITPTLAVCDMHPNYHSSDFARSLGIPVLQVQHHHAHVSSVMAEHDIKKRVIGVAFDGTGYGTDGNVWGGEFLICEGAEFIRVGMLRYTRMLGGDESMKDAKKTATCYLIGNGLSEYATDDRKEIIKAALVHQINTVLTSSMGRLFDAVASILDLGQYNHYEGECAIALEREAALAIRTGRKAQKLSFAFQDNEILELDPGPVLKELCRLKDKSDIGSLALGFHEALAEAIVIVCDKLRSRYQSNLVALCGGVFQNSILMETTLRQLREKDFEVFVNQAVPPGDGAISLGQVYVALNQELS